MGKFIKKKYYAFKNKPFCDDCGQTTRLSQEKVSNYFNKFDCKLLSEYVNNNSPLKFKCKCGNISEKCFKVFKKSHQCNECSGFKTYTLDECKTLFFKNDCELLEKQFVSARAKMKYKCKCGNISEICLDKFLEGKRCKQCGLRKGSKNGRWNPNREIVKLNQIIAQRSLAHLKYMLKKQGKRKNKKAKEYLGYTTAELRNRITNHPNWTNVKDGDWHIDHIFPIKAFLENGITDTKIINALNNLQPLSGKENLNKSSKYNKEEFKKWLKTECN